MNPTVFCPHCRQHLPVQAAPPAGTSVQCYHCNSTFIIGQQPPGAPQAAGYAQQPTFSPPSNYGGYRGAAAPSAWTAQTPPPKPAPLESRSSVSIWGAIVGGVALGLLLLGVGIYFLRPTGTTTAAANMPPPAVAPAPVVAPTSTAPPLTAPGVSAPPPASSASPTPVAVTAKSDVPSLTYRFEPGMRYHYSFHLKAETSGNNDAASRTRFGAMPFPVRANNSDYRGSVFYEPRKVEPHLIREHLGEKTGEGSGTAFVVHSDGYLVTCEHVIRSAAKVEVTLNQKTYAARVLAADRKHDLAVLKIEAQGLKSLALGNSDQVQLAEEVRAVGFPLSDVLGTSVKVTRGTVSGLVDRGEKLLQIDASINPGNSGGPLVNAKGEVMGVCSSGLFGESISHVGFAVPANEVRQLLQAKGYATNGAAVSAQLDGPELARQVTPGVAFVKVTIGADAANACLLDFSGMISNLSSIGSPSDGRGQVLLTRDGEVTSIKGDSSLPFLVGTYGGLVIDKLPYSGETSWESRNVCSLSITTTQEEEDSFGPFGRGFPGRLGGRFRSPFDRPQQQTTIVPAVETTRWKLGPRTGNIQVLNKQYEFTTSEKDNETKSVEMTGEGTVSFDLSKGIPQECKMTFNYRGTRNNVTVRIPITFSYQLYKAQTQEEWQKEVQAAAEKAKQANPSSTPSSSLTPDATASTPTPAKPDASAKAREHLQKIGSAKNPSELYVAMSNLGFMEPVPELRDQVSKAIDPFLTSKDSNPRQGAIGAVKKWFTEHNIPSLLKLVDSLDDSARRGAIECLGMHSKDPKIAMRIAECLKHSDDRYTAEAALKKMGSIAEDAVLPLLAEDDEEVRGAICDVLRETGTAKCVPELEKLAQSKSNRTIKSRAESALRQIHRRLGKKD